MRRLRLSAGVVELARHPGFRCRCSKERGGSNPSARIVCPDQLGRDQRYPVETHDAGAPAVRDPRCMTLIWFVVWVISDHAGGRAPLRFDPANAWAWTLLLAVALDLASRHARAGRRHG
jgi:hypothetical protein